MTADLVTRVRRRIAADPVEVDDAVRAEAGLVDDVVLAALRDDVNAELVGAGPLEPLLALPGVTDVLVNGPDDVWIDRGAGLQRAVVQFADDASVRRLAQRLATAAGRRLDDAQPFVDAALPDGTRLHAVLPPLVKCTTISLRVLARERYDLDTLAARGAFPPQLRPVLEAIVRARIALLISGGTGSGKTTLLGALLAHVPPDERILVIEDSAELVIDHPHVVRLVARVANVEGSGVVPLPELVRQSLRMRPDRLVAGEFRGSEIAELLVALNTGHEGGAATLHANSAADVPARCIALAALAGMSSDAATNLVAGAVDLVIQLRRTARARFVDEIAVLHAPELRSETVWAARVGFGPAAPMLATLL